MPDLKKIFLHSLVLVLWFVGAVAALASDYEPYVSRTEIPDALVYLPAPPDSSQVATNGDFARWLWGRAQRNTPRGEQASWETKYGMVRMCTIYSDVLGIDITEDDTPAIYRLMARAGATGAISVSAMKHAYYRRRPYLVMNDSLWGQYDSYSELNTNSSYPSSHTSFGWGTALALAEMAPHMQDTILRRGYEYGISRVIVGAHWQSDVDAAMLCSSTAISRARCTDDYASDMVAARAEYMSLKGLTDDDIKAGFPEIVKIIDTPPLEYDNLLIGDICKYWETKALRYTPRGVLANEDISTDDNYIINMFADCSPVVTISPTETPDIAAFISIVKLVLSSHCTNLKKCVYRKRPFFRYNETPPPGSELWELYSESSYPSRHGMIGWGVALALTEVMPDCQDSILKRGLEYGDSRVIIGRCYASDVQAARVMAACDLGKLHNENFFNIFLEKARQEYARKKEEAGIETIITQSALNPDAWYSISGIILPDQPTTPGIYIHGGMKLMIGN